MKKFVGTLLAVILTITALTSSVSAQEAAKPEIYTAPNGVRYINPLYQGKGHHGYMGGKEGSSESKTNQQPRRSMGHMRRGQ